jgi:MOSC domain-containing protein YiiM
LKVRGEIAAGEVVSVSSDSLHRFSKMVQPEIQLLAGLGVLGDAHLGETVQHRSRVAADPTQPNLRQVHLIHAELMDELAEKGFRVKPGDLGENILTQGIDLLALPRGTSLRIGSTAVIEITGLRNPCSQIEAFQPGLLAALLPKDSAGNVVRKSGVMAIVLESGSIAAGDLIAVDLPPPPHKRLERV